MINLIIDKINLFHPTITNIASLFFLTWAFFHKAKLVHSIKDYLYFWIFRPLFTYPLGPVVTLGLGLLKVPRLADLSPLPVLLQFILFYLMCDFVIYLIHYACHNNKRLFRLHHVHHQIDSMSWENGLKDTIYFEYLCVFTFATVAYFFNISILILASTLLCWKIMLAFPHYQRPIKFKGFLELVFVSPERHLIHHDRKANQAFNYGLTLSVWDNFFEMFYRKLKKT